jgi:N,N'-diacetyllegionaminate synthase
MSHISFSQLRRIDFSNNSVGDGCPCFITFEAGPTHDGFSSAYQLVSLAAEAGADAVKFQIFDADRLVADKNQLFDYEILVDRESGESKTIREPLYDILKRRCLSQEEWLKIKKHSDTLDLAFFATVGFEEDIELLMEMGCDSIKIASADVNHYPLMRKAAQTGMCIQLDTGNATLGEIENAVSVIHETGNSKIIIHHCPSGYPARLTGINLNIIQTLRQLFLYPIAFSDHSPGVEMDIAAVALGANLVEKTITLDRMTPSVEHMFSLEPKEAIEFIRSIRNLEIALGKPRRVLHPKEHEQRTKIRRSAFSTHACRAGTLLKNLAIEFRRPGDGISPDRWDMLGEAKLTKDIDAGEKITLQHIIWP